jgi:hypothetical protein
MLAALVGPGWTAVERRPLGAVFSSEGVLGAISSVDSTAAQGVHGLVDEYEDIRIVVKQWVEIEALPDAARLRPAIR